MGAERILPGVALLLFIAFMAWLLTPKSKLKPMKQMKLKIKIWRGKNG